MGTPERSELLDYSSIKRPIIGRFEQIADRVPNKIALDDGRFRLTYREAQQAARHLALRIDAAVPIGRAVGVFLPNGALFPIAALACLAAGRVYVPIDQNYPLERSDLIVQEAGLSAVIFDPADGAACPSLAATHHLDITKSLNQRTDHRFPFPQIDGPAVVLYTSGSTGRPKGICNNQAAILQRVVQFTKTCKIISNDRFILLSSPGTIAGIRDTLTALVNGATLYIADPYRVGMSGIIDVVWKHEITICYAVPALLRELLRMPMAMQAFDNLRVLRFGGDSVLANDLTLCRSFLPETCNILVGFGSTEVPTIFQWFVPPGWTPDGPTIPCGYPLSDTSILFQTENGAPAARGEIAEVVVKSRYVALGTWQDGRLHSGTIQTDPHDPAVRIIHTADLVRLRGDGLVELVGRKDRQLKIRGFRIDPGDVETALRRCADVADVVVTGSRLGGTDVVVAYAVPRVSNTTVIRERLHNNAKTLPVHMRPARIYLVDEIPRLPSFKPDITKLQNLENSISEGTADPGRPRNAAVSESERKILTICRQLLQTDNLDLNDSFFDAGGNSLSAMNLMLEIESQLGLKISLDTIFNYSIAELCATLDETAEPEAAAILPVKIRGRKSLYFVHSGFEFGALSDALASDISTAFIATNRIKWLRELISRGDVLGAIDQISEAYAKAIFARHATEPQYLAGHSFGGIIAVETACKLEEQGAAPDIVFLFDTYLHGSLHRILYDIRHNGWLTRKLKEFVRGNRREIMRRASFLSRNAFYRLTESAIFKKSWTNSSTDIDSIFRELREEASQVYRGPKRPLVSRTVLFRATKSVSGRTMKIDPDLGWARQFGANLTVVMTPGNHETLLSNEYVNYVASEMDRQIDLKSPPAQGTGIEYELIDVPSSGMGQQQ